MLCGQGAVLPSGLLCLGALPVQEAAPPSVLFKLGSTEPFSELRDWIQAWVGTTTWVPSCPPLGTPQCRWTKAGPVSWVPQEGAPSLAPCFPACRGYGEPSAQGAGRSGPKVVPQSHLWPSCHRSSQHHPASGAGSLQHRRGAQAHPPGTCQPQAPPCARGRTGSA